MICLSVWALPHQHQPVAPSRFKPPTDPTWVHTDINKTIAKLISSLLPIMIIFTKTFLQLTPREPPLHWMLCHFCRGSRWAEPGLGRALSRCFAGGFGGWRYPAIDQDFAMSSRSHLASPPPQRNARGCKQGHGDLKSKESWAAAPRDLPFPPRFCILILEQETTSKTAVLSATDLPQRLLKPAVVQEMGWSLETQLLQKSHLYYEYMNNERALGVTAE